MLSYGHEYINVNTYNIYWHGVWQVPYIASSLVGVNLGSNGHRDPFDWVTIQLTKLNDQRYVVQLRKLRSLALQV